MPKYPARSLDKIFPKATTKDALDLLSKMLEYYPEKRLK